MIVKTSSNPGPISLFLFQCCYVGEVPKAVLLRHVYEELEICFKSLVGYLVSICILISVLLWRRSP